LKNEALRIFGGLSGSYDAVLDCATLFQDRRWKEWAMESAKIESTSEVLDVGCGTCVLEERMKRDARVVGVDLVEPMLRRGQRKGLRNVRSLLLSDGEFLPFKDASFDVVVSCYVVKYCNAESLVSEFARVLRPGGRLVLYDFVRPRGPLRPFSAAYVYAGLRLAGMLFRAIGAHSAYTFSELPLIIAHTRWEEEFITLLAGCGFTSAEGRLLSGGVTLGFCAERAQVVGSLRRGRLESLSSPLHQARFVAFVL